MTAITATEEGTAMTVRSWLRPPMMYARKIGGKIEGPTGNKTAVRTVRPTVVKIGRWTDERIGVKTVKLIGARIGRWTGWKIAGPTPVVNCGGWIGPIALPVSMGEKAGRMLVLPRWIALTGRTEWTVLTNSTGRRDRTDPRGLTGQIVQIVWNDRNVRIDLTGQSVRNGQNDRNGRTNRSGPAGTNTAGLSDWKMIGSRVS